LRAKLALRQAAVRLRAARLSFVTIFPSSFGAEISHLPESKVALSESPQVRPMVDPLGPHYPRLSRSVQAGPEARKALKNQHFKPLPSLFHRSAPPSSALAYHQNTIGSGEAACTHTSQRDGVSHIEGRRDGRLVGKLSRTAPLCSVTGPPRQIMTWHRTARPSDGRADSRGRAPQRNAPQARMAARTTTKP
jgi:hypothetical protein